MPIKPDTDFNKAVKHLQEMFAEAKKIAIGKGTNVRVSFTWEGSDHEVVLSVQEPNYDELVAEDDDG